MFSVIILAAGQGKRANLSYNKMLYNLNGTTIIERSLNAFLNNSLITQIIIVSCKGDRNNIKEILDNDSIIYVTGGKERYHSVYNGLQLCTNKYVLIHDGARCFLTSDLVNKLINSTLEYDAAFLGVKSKDTIHIINDKNSILTPNREQVYLAQTPQGFKTTLIKQAYDELFENLDTNVTDDVMILNEYLNITSKVVESSYENIKVTTPEDFI